MTSKPAKPIWGFGWAGWMLLPIALGMFWCYLRGPDLRFKLLELINDTLGTDAVFWTVGSPIYQNGLAITATGLGWWGLMYVALALQIHPRRSRWWLLPVVAWCAVRPVIYAHSLIRPGSGVAGILAPVTGGVLSRESTTVLACCGIDLVLLVVITRSWLVFLASVLGTAGAIGIEQWLTARTSPVSQAWTVWPAYVWHLSAGAAILAWSISERRRTARPGLCASCGYDLRGLNNRPCPECGTQGTVEATVSRTPVHSSP